MKTADIKALIPKWVTNSVINDIATGYECGYSTADVTKWMNDIGNWKRYAKHKFDSNTIERIFDNIEFDGTLRLYVHTDITDTNIIYHSFEIE